jgi:hypothetical protein
MDEDTITDHLNPLYTYVPLSVLQMCQELSEISMIDAFGKRRQSCFSPAIPGPRAVPQTARNNRRPEHLQHITTEHSYLFSSLARESSCQQAAVSTTQESFSQKQKQQRVVKANDSGVINNRHSANDWLYNLKSLPKSSVLREIKHPVLTLTAWATLVGFLYTMLRWSGRNNLTSNLCVPPAAH